MLAAGLALCAAPGTADTALSYSNGTVGTTYLFKTFTDQTGLAMRLSPEKVAMLKGRTIKAIEMSTGTKRLENQKLFVGTDLKAPAYTQDFTLGRANKWISYELTTPYVISGDEPELFIGFTGTVTDSNVKPLSGDYAAALPGAGFALYGDQWRDIASLNVGCPNIRIILDGDQELTDAIVKPFAPDGYFRAAESLSFPSQILNFGNKAINGFTLEARIGQGEPKTLTFSDVIEPGASFDFTLPEYVCSEAGTQPVAVTVNVDGDADASDNAASTEVFFYPADMERAILLESFTGQKCGNCPRGHQNTDDAISAWKGPEIVQVYHHSGYQPDSFTMNADYDYTFFYKGGGGMYAPASMVNRLTNPESNIPVFNTSEDALTSAFQSAANKEPYVSLSMTSDYNEETRALAVHVEAYTHRALPAGGTKVLNVFICQNGMREEQSGVGITNFDHTFRGCLTATDYIAGFEGTPSDGAWGVARDFVPGSHAVLDLNTTLPEYIWSDYYTEATVKASPYSFDQCNKATDPANMYLIAYVATYDSDDDPNGHTVYNCVQVPLMNGAKAQGGFVGVDNLLAPEQALPAIRVNGNAVSTDAGAALEVYTLQGARVDAASLAPGIYLARATAASGAVRTSKIAIR